MRQCMAEYHPLAIDHPELKNLSDTADRYYDQQKKKIATYKTLALLDGLVPPMWKYKDDVLRRMEERIAPPEPLLKPLERKEEDKTAARKIYKPVFRQSLLKPARLESDAEIDAYVDKLRDQLKRLLKGAEGIELK